MALSWNEIKDRALRFSREWEGESRERAEKDTFWNEFLEVFGISRRRVATFEEHVKLLGNSSGYIDLFWPGMLLAEHKSKGKNLNAAFKQAIDYFHGIKDVDLPKFVIVSDFERFRVYDLDEKQDHEFNLEELHEHVSVFSEIAGYKKKEYKDEDPVNIKAAEMMGGLHDHLKDSGYEGHELEVFLVRLLFCLFADDTGIFEKDTFRELIETKTSVDGSNLGSFIETFFEILNTPENKRNKLLDEQIAAFPYINGKLFEERLHTAYFNSEMRTMLLEVSRLNWGLISPAIFGSMFQSIMNPEERRNLGAHYTSEKNILKLIKPLFLDELWNEFEKVKNSSKKLEEFHTKLGTLKFLDPACGSGNFLIITYRELRSIELEVLKILYKDEMLLDIQNFIKCDVDQFYGIEYEEFPAKIAEVALWLMDHQMNIKVSETFGQYFARLPLKKSATIVHGNSLRLEWKSIIPNNELNYILGNPPFYGKKEQTSEQKEDMQLVFQGLRGSGTLDYVTAWYLKAAQYIQETKIKVAFVSTNSITQGEQPGVIWKDLFENYYINIHFAHRTFQWKNEARNNASVHVVIIGFACFNSKDKQIFEYDNIKGEPHVLIAKNINCYLVDSTLGYIESRTNPICNVASITRGSEATDDGHFIITEEERSLLIDKFPQSQSFIRPFQGGKDIINNKIRWCLWLKNIPANNYKDLTFVMDRIKSVKAFRSASKKERTQKWAEFPTLFSEDRQPQSHFLALPKVTSERRKYLPIAYMEPNIIINNTVSALPISDIWYFGILTSIMHMTWLKYVCGRTKSDLNYSIKIVYNNFPWPKDPNQKKVSEVEKKAEEVISIRKKYAEYSLADLYDPLTMPPELVRAHQSLDKSVDQCYRPQPFPNESKRVEYLFNLFSEYEDR